jgi:glycine cleavage system aminomethyltransferase T
MAGQPGYEFIGNYEDHDFVRDAFLEAGEEFGIARIGALAYAINNLEGGWIPTPTPAIFTDASLRDYREWLPFFSFEGQNGFHGSYYSEAIEDYYLSPYELGYGRSVSFGHDYLGRDALKELRDKVTRAKVTLELDAVQARAAFGDGYFLSHARDRVETEDGRLVGITYHTGPLDPRDVVLSLALVETAHAEPGTRLQVIRGEHPGPGSSADAAFDSIALDVTVRPAPYGDFARTRYRRNEP